MERWGTYDPENFLQLYSIYPSNITPGECDFLMNTLLRDKKLRKQRPNDWNKFFSKLVDINREILFKEAKNSGYTKEYASFMTERENERTEANTDLITTYNNQVLDWRFGEI